MPVRFNPSAMRVRTRRRTRTIKARQDADNNILIQELQRSLLASADFRQVIDQIEQRLARSLIQQLAAQPLRQAGQELGAAARGLLGGAEERFLPSAAQTGALLRQIIDGAEGIL